MAKGSHLLVDRKQSKRNERDLGQDTDPSDLLPPAGSHLPKFSPPPQTASIAGDLAFNR
jgi:hypothetical protein